MLLVYISKLLIATRMKEGYMSSSPAKAPQTPQDNQAHTNLDVVSIIGRIASALSVIMYVSYVTQIANNLAGHPGTPWQPLCAFFNCTMWTLYGALKPKKDWPIIVANLPGIILGLITFITSFIH